MQGMQRCALAISSVMITTLMPRPQTDMPHLRIGPYKEGVTIVQIQMPFYLYSAELDMHVSIHFIMFPHYTVEIR